jgi:hypothetical protein
MDWFSTTKIPYLQSLMDEKRIFVFGRHSDQLQQQKRIKIKMGNDYSYSKTNSSQTEDEDEEERIVVIQVATHHHLDDDQEYLQIETVIVLQNSFLSSKVETNSISISFSSLQPLRKQGSTSFGRFVVAMTATPNAECDERRSSQVHSRCLTISCAKRA